MVIDANTGWQSPLQALRTALIWIGVAIAAFILWKIRIALLIAFGAVLGAILLDSLAAWFRRRLRMSHKIGLGLAICLVAGLIVATIWLFGSQIAQQLGNVVEHIRIGEQYLNSELASSRFAGIGRGLTREGSSFISNSIASLLSLSLGVVEGVVVWAISAIYLAAQPELYRRGIAQLFSLNMQRHAAEVVEYIGGALRLWLLGQLVLMLSVGALSFVAFWSIGLPNSGALAFIAGVAEIIPYLGPFISAVPALLVALTQGPHAALWTLAAYVVIHIFEGYIVAPVLQQRFVTVPPALTLTGIVAAELLFGMMGVILAAPIIVAVYAAVNVFYVRETLGNVTQVPRRLAALHAERSN